MKPPRSCGADVLCSCCVPMLAANDMMDAGACVHQSTSGINVFSAEGYGLELCCSWIHLLP